MQPSDRRLVTEASLASLLAGGSADVRFEGNSGVSGVNTVATLAAGTFAAVPIGIGALGGITTNVGGGTWDSTNYLYTVPVSGLYLCLATLRILDSSSTRSTHLNVHTSNADHPTGLWRNTGSGRDVSEHVRIGSFTAGDVLRSVYYSDGATFPMNAASLTIILLRSA